MPKQVKRETYFEESSNNLIFSKHPILNSEVWIRVVTSENIHSNTLFYQGVTDSVDPTPQQHRLLTSL